MSDRQTKPEVHTGGCLCGAITYRIEGPLRDVVNCHCGKCRRWHGHAPAYTSVKRPQLTIEDNGALKWFRSVTDETPDVYRGFCRECGSSLFWDARGLETIAVTAGSLDEPTGLKTIGHIWLDQAGDYYELTDDLKRFGQRWVEG